MNNYYEDDELYEDDKDNDEEITRGNNINFHFSKDLEARLKDLYRLIKEINDTISDPDWLDQLVEILINYPGFMERIIEKLKEDKNLVEAIKAAILADELFKNKVGDYLIDNEEFIQKVADKLSEVGIVTKQYVDDQDNLRELKIDHNIDITKIDEKIDTLSGIVDSHTNEISNLQNNKENTLTAPRLLDFLEAGEGIKIELIDEKILISEE